MENEREKEDRARRRRSARIWRMNATSESRLLARERGA